MKKRSLFATILSMAVTASPSLAIEARVSCFMEGIGSVSGTLPIPRAEPARLQMERKDGPELRAVLRLDERTGRIGGTVSCHAESGGIIVPINVVGVAGAFMEVVDDDPVKMKVSVTTCEKCEVP